MCLTDRVGAHGSEVGGKGEEGEGVEEQSVHQAIQQVACGHEHDKEHHELGEEHQQPGDDAAHNAAAVADEPHVAGAGARLRRRGAVLRAQVAGLPLDVPAAVRRAHHPTSHAASACCRTGGRRQKPSFSYLFIYFSYTVNYALFFAHFYVLRVSLENSIYQQNLTGQDREKEKIN